MSKKSDFVGCDLPIFIWSDTLQIFRICGWVSNDKSTHHLLGIKLAAYRVGLKGFTLEKETIIKSIGYCGLICIFCHLSDKCDGCKSENNNCGKHLSEAGCFQRNCSIQKGIDGCWECDDFPCDKDMYSDSCDPKVKAFARCIREDGIEEFIDFVIRNNKRRLDVRFHGDYDLKTESEVLLMLRTGKQI